MQDAFEKRRVILGITGSIAAYKAAELARLLVSWGFEVRVVMTGSALEFVSALTFQAITGNAVTTTFWDDTETTGIGHIQLADWADAVVIAPCTADCIAKLAAGFADTPLLAVCLATKAPVLLAPAMNVNMLEHVKTRENIEALRTRGVRFVDPDEGALACGWNGAGRLADPQEIFYHVRRVLSPDDFAGKKILLTTGPTREAIDPVRFLSNRSSGKMGVSLAREAFRRGADVTMIHGPIKSKVPGAVKCHEVVTAQEMFEAVMAHAFPADRSLAPDIVIMSAAVADYRPKEVATMKMKRAKGVGSIDVVPNPDILSELGSKRGEETSPMLVGFAVETGELEDLLSEARNKLKSKHVDMIVGNFAEEALELDTNRVWFVDRTGRQEEIATTYKSRVANKILDAVLRLY